MSNVLNISSGKDLSEPNLALVEYIGDLLECAKSGELQSIFATGIMSDGSRLKLIVDSDYPQFYKSLGAINMLAFEYANINMDG